MPIIKVMDVTKCTKGKEQCDFRQGRDCMDQVFVKADVKISVKWEDVF